MLGARVGGLNKEERKRESRLGKCEEWINWRNVVGLVGLMKDPLEIFGHEFKVKPSNKVTCPPSRFRCWVLTWSSAENCI